MAFYEFLATTIAITTIGVLGTFLLTGMNGLFSLGQAAFMGIAAYISAICVVNMGLPFPLAIFLSILSALIVAFLVGMATLRIRQDFFALATFGFGQAVLGLLTESVSVTGGALGFSNIPHLTTLPIALISLIVAVFFVVGIRRSHYGRDSLAIRSNEIAAQSSGINVFRHRLLIYLVSAVFAAYAGALMAFHNRYVEPKMFQWIASVTWIIIVFFGGRDSLTGTLFGSFILLTLPEILRFASEWRISLYCVIILLIINLRPMGLFGKWEFSLKPLFRIFFKKKPQEET